MRNDGKSTKKKPSRKIPEEPIVTDHQLIAVEDPEALKLEILHYVLGSGLPFYRLEAYMNSDLGDLVLAFKLKPDPEGDVLTGLPEDDVLTDCPEDDEQITLH